jgi:serine/threonine protein kinase
MDTRMPLSAGTRLGVFQILAPLGKGGMGEVYRAKDSKLDREVAVKILPEERAERPERMARFEREAKLLAALDHPHIAAIHGFHEEGGQHFLVMELVGRGFARVRLGIRDSALGAFRSY